MRLIEYIKRLNTKILFKYLLQGEEKVHFSEALYESLFEKVTVPSFFEEQITDFGDDDFETLYSIYLSGKKGVIFDANQNKAALLRSFLVYERTEGEDLALVPFDEFNSAVAKSLFKESETALDVTGFPLPFRDVFKTDIAILFGLLVKKGSVLKQTGFVTKQFQDTYLAVTYIGGLIDSLSLTDKECEGLIDYLLSVLESCHYIRREYNLIKVSSQVEGDLQSLFVSIRDEICSQLEESGLNRSFLAELVEMGTLSLDKKLLSGTGFYALVLYAWLGELMIAPDGKAVVVRNSTVPELNTYYPSGHMMPDFSVMIPREIDPVSLYEYMKIGTVDSLDMIYKGTICRETIVDSVAGTFTEGSVRSVIASWNGAANLFTTVEEWIHGFNKLFVDGSYLAVKGSDADSVTALPEIAPLVSEVEGYRFFRIKNGKATLLETILKSKSFDTRFSDSTEPSHLFSEETLFSSEKEEQVNYDPEMESSTAPMSQGGIYSSQLKELSVGDIGKLVKYATLMDYKLTINYIDEFGAVHNHIITPINLSGGKESFIEASDDTGSVKKFLLDKIEKIGVLSDDS